jgi:hypothetical protein
VQWCPIERDEWAAQRQVLPNKLKQRMHRMVAGEGQEEACSPRASRTERAGRGRRQMHAITIIIRTSDRTTGSAGPRSLDLLTSRHSTAQHSTLMSAQETGLFATKSFQNIARSYRENSHLQRSRRTFCCWLRGKVTTTHEAEQGSRKSSPEKPQPHTQQRLLL